MPNFRSEIFQRELDQTLEFGSLFDVGEGEDEGILRRATQSKQQKSYNPKKNKAYTRYMEFEGERVVRIVFRKKKKMRR